MLAQGRAGLAWGERSEGLWEGLAFWSKGKRIREECFIRQVAQRGKVALGGFNDHRRTAGVDFMTGQIAVIVQYRTMHKAGTSLPGIFRQGFGEHRSEFDAATLPLPGFVQH